MTAHNITNGRTQKHRGHKVNRNNKNKKEKIGNEQQL